MVRSASVDTDRHQPGHDARADPVAGRPDTSPVEALGVTVIDRDDRVGSAYDLIGPWFRELG